MTPKGRIRRAGLEALHGRPVARLGPLVRPGRTRRLGPLDGKFRVPDNFNEPLPDEVIAAFEGRRR